MAEISEKQARAICSALGVNPDVVLSIYTEPNWRIAQITAERIAQRAAEAEEKKP